MQKINIAYNCKESRKQQKHYFQRNWSSSKVHLSFQKRLTTPKSPVTASSIHSQLPNPSVPISRCVWPWPCHWPDLSVTVQQLQVKDPAQPLGNAHLSHAGITKFYKMTLIPWKWWLQPAWRLPWKKKYFHLAALPCLCNSTGENR